MSGCQLDTIIKYQESVTLARQRCEVPAAIMTTDRLSAFKADISGLLLLMVVMMPTDDVMSVAGKQIMQIMSDVDDIRLYKIISPLGPLHKIEILPQPA